MRFGGGALAGFALGLGPGLRCGPRFGLFARLLERAGEIIGLFLGAGGRFGLGASFGFHLGPGFGLSAGARFRFGFDPRFFGGASGGLGFGLCARLCLGAGLCLGLCGVLDLATRLFLGGGLFALLALRLRRSLRCVVFRIDQPQPAARQAGCTPPLASGFFRSA
jgi:hypothetical protein